MSTSWHSDFIEQKCVYHSSKIMYKTIHHPAVHDSLKFDTTQMTTNRRTDEVITVYSYNGILYINENKWTVTTCIDMDKSHPNTEWKKPGTKGCLLYDSIHIKFESKWIISML